MISVQQNAKVSSMEQHMENYKSFNHSVNKWFEKHLDSPIVNTDGYLGESAIASELAGYRQGGRNSRH